VRSRSPTTNFQAIASIAQVVLCLSLLFPCVAAAQTIRPVIMEYPGQAKGRFELLNNSLLPANVILEVRGFRITLTGQAIYEDLDPVLHVKLSATSLRIPPKQGRFVFYEAKADRLPAWFVVNCIFVGRASRSGLNIDIGLPHTVYLLQRDSIDRSDVHILKASLLSGPPRLAVDIENTSPKLARVTECQISSGRLKRTYGGFPLVPLGRRHLEIAWDGQEPPAKLLLRFQHFSVEEALTNARQ
jgi:hypothetical protein